MKIYLPDYNETVNVYDCNTFPYMEVLDADLKRKHKAVYYNINAAFDIESTTIRCPHMETCERMFSGECISEKCAEWIEPDVYMYHWQACIGESVIFGRTWNEFLTFLQNLRERLELSSKKMLVFYVHNLSYEFQFLKDIIPVDSVMAIERNRILKFTSNGFEFRCSYKLSNMSLAKFCENTENVIHGKIEGGLDYNIIRTPDTPLTELEKEYCYCDVKGLSECIAEYLKTDTIVSIPLTSTGFVRRECRSAVQENVSNIRRFRREKLTPRQYILCREAFRGGDTHANAIYVGDILENIRSFDKASSYPWQLMSKKYPGKFIKGSAEKIDQYLKKDFACLMVVSIKDAVYKSYEGMPYIPYAKIRMPRGGEYVNDNGRILFADYLEMVMTEIDYKIILEDYSFSEIKILEIHVSKKEYIPIELRECIMEYFRKKCCLKGIDGKEYEYMKSKNKLNAIYGMMVTDIIREVWEMNLEDGEWTVSKPDTADALNSYYKNRNSFLSYQWGVWVTAYARMELKECQKITGSDTVYVDTDSVKFTGDYSQEFAEYNKRIIAEAENLEFPPIIDHDGKRYIMGVMEDEGEYMEFRTWGAKKYAWKKFNKRENKTVYRTVVAGLGVKEGSDYIKKHGIESFRLNTTFFPSGRNTMVYISKALHEKNVNGCRFISGSGIAMLPTTYTLNVTKEYLKLII